MELENEDRALKDAELIQLVYDPLQDFQHPLNPLAPPWDLHQADCMQTSPTKVLLTWPGCFSIRSIFSIPRALPAFPWEQFLPLPTRVFVGGVSQAQWGQVRALPGQGECSPRTQTGGSGGLSLWDLGGCCPKLRFNTADKKRKHRRHHPSLRTHTASGCRTSELGSQRHIQHLSWWGESHRLGARDPTQKCHSKWESTQGSGPTGHRQGETEQGEDTLGRLWGNGWTHSIKGRGRNSLIRVLATQRQKLEEGCAW